MRHTSGPAVSMNSLDTFIKHQPGWRPVRRAGGPGRPGAHLLSTRLSCSLPLMVTDLSCPSSSTSTRSCPFSTMRLVVTLCPLTISVDDITDLKPELPAPEPPKEVEEKVVRLAPPPALS